MFWADVVAKELKKRKLSLEWVDDMKTPSGRVHVGALRGVVIHDLVFKALKDAGVKTKYTYIFDNHDPMDSLPVYLPKEKFEKYLGMPLYKIPSPELGFDNYAQFYAEEFMSVFNAIGCHPEIIWATDLYLSRKMNSLIKVCLDKTDIIRKIYEEVYKKKISSDWYPFQAYCPNCGKVSTTKVYKWDGEFVYFKCTVNGLGWTKGCGYDGKVSPLSNKKGINGKLPWKVEWACKWKAVGVTVEGAGKDHMSRGGSHDIASLICKRVINYEVPYPLPYEFFLIEGKKMSSSKGLGSSAKEMLKILPSEILRFLMVKTRINQAINFDPAGDTIPKLFDDYQLAGQEYFKKGQRDKDLARIFELSQVDKIESLPKIRFMTLAQWVQMPNLQNKIREEGLEEWAKYARIWLDRYASESVKFEIQKKIPKEVKILNKKQKAFLKKVAEELTKDWNAEEFQKKLYDWAKELDLSSEKAFQALYIPLIGKDHGPKAGWLILEYKEFVQKRFQDVSFVQS
ncbi:MAG: lysine--tRNA ligase [Candidatus Levybacteria bacterium RIFCSPLOWO2_01_FULL_38_21]|nr:MAG: lysine--tRNA ligase [Candidatus Levybacteria bacterium RIFCSPLOWO2_01_FULL_38_21]